MRARAWGITGAFLFLVISGCGTALREIKPTQDLVVPVQTPILVVPDQMETVTFGRTIVDIPVGVTVGKVVIDDRTVREIKTKEANLGAGAPVWSRMGLEELRTAGYPVLGQENLLFNQDESGKSRYVVGGTVQNLTWVVHSSAVQYSDSETPMECGVTVNWQIFDTNTRQVVLSKRVRGYAEFAGAAPVINGSVRSSFRSLLADPEFVTALKKKGLVSISNPAPNVPALSVKSPHLQDLELPKQMQRVTDSVVTVRVGSIHGSGFFLSPDGYILTAAHVVSGRETCLCKLSDGRQAEARVMRIDNAFDVALLKVIDGSYSALQLSNGESPEVGSEVYAIGTPLLEELERSVSKGIVSAVRSKEGRDLIQTDAAVNHGNSGGPLIDRTGHVIGIVSLKVALPGYEGIGFAIPIQTAIRRLALNVSN